MSAARNNRVAAFGLATSVLVAASSVVSPAFSATRIELKPQPGVALLGVNCGGIHTSTYVTGFDDDGNITGEVYAWTRCGGSGRGGGYRTKRYHSWHSIVWDLNGVVLSTLPYDGIVPDVTFTETDDAGDTVYTVSKSTSHGTAYVGMLSVLRPGRRACDRDQENDGPSHGRRLSRAVKRLAG